MSPELKEYETKVMQLPVEDRAVLAEHLIASLDHIDDSECERLWVEEAERRYQQYKQGNIASRPAGDVLRDARAAVK